MTAQDSRTRQTECDLLVVGSGAGGLSAATTAAWHGLRVVVVEKDRVCGGATAWSGGWAWVPLNPLSQADGIVEDLDGPRTYLKHVLGEHYDAARVDALLDAGRHMVAFFEQNTALQFVSGTWIADIQGHVPGAGTGGRSVGPKPINGRALGGHLLDKLRSQLYETSFLGLGIMAGPDLQAFLHATRSPRAFAHAGWRVGFHAFDLATRRQGMQLVNGLALIGRLLKSADDLGVELWVSSPAKRLLIDDGAVQGAVVDTPDGEVTIRARRGTVLAAIRKPPFYAIKVLPGSFGTFAGLRTDARARVLNAAGDPVPGLYAVGCDQASVMGGDYPSGGINIGPALTFGYIAGRHCAGATEYENRVPVPQNDGV